MNRRYALPAGCAALLLSLALGGCRAPVQKYSALAMTSPLNILVAGRAAPDWEALAAYTDQEAALFDWRVPESPVGRLNRGPGPGPAAGGGRGPGGGAGGGLGQRGGLRSDGPAPGPVVVLRHRRPAAAGGGHPAGPPPGGLAPGEPGCRGALPAAGGLRPGPGGHRPGGGGGPAGRLAGAEGFPAVPGGSQRGHPDRRDQGARRSPGPWPSGTRATARPSSGS